MEKVDNVLEKLHRKFTIIFVIITMLISMLMRFFGINELYDRGLYIVTDLLIYFLSLFSLTLSVFSFDKRRVKRHQEIVSGDNFANATIYLISTICVSFKFMPNILKNIAIFTHFAGILLVIVAIFLEMRLRIVNKNVTGDRELHFFYLVIVMGILVATIPTDFYRFYGNEKVDSRDCGATPC
jgi:hypothetical protein